MFIDDISMGQEVFIPKDLSQDIYPKSFRYYDAIFHIIHDSISDDRKEFFHSKNLEKYISKNDFRH